MKDTAIHLHKRKRIHENLEPYPHSNPKIRFLDNLIMVVAIIFPFTALPQIYNIWINNNVDGVSLTSWSLFFILSIPFLIYGIVHKEKPLIVMYSLWLVVHASVITGIVLFG